MSHSRLAWLACGVMDSLITSVRFCLYLCRVTKIPILKSLALLVYLRLWDVYIVTGWGIIVIGNGAMEDHGISLKSFCQIRATLTAVKAHHPCSMKHCGCSQEYVAERLHVVVVVVTAVVGLKVTANACCSLRHLIVCVPHLAHDAPLIFGCQRGCIVLFACAF